MRKLIFIILILILVVFISGRVLFPECKINDDCESNQKCTENKCINLTCGECQYIFNHTCIDYMCCADEDCKVTEECDTTAHTCQRLVPTRTEEAFEECPLLDSVFAEEFKLDPEEKPEEIERGLKYGTLSGGCKNDPLINVTLERACKWDEECCPDLPEVTDTESAQDLVKKFVYCYFMYYIALGPGAPAGPIVSTKVTTSSVSKLKHGYIMYTVPYHVTVRESTVEVTGGVQWIEGWTYLSNSGCVLACLGKE